MPTATQLIESFIGPTVPPGGQSLVGALPWGLSLAPYNQGFAVTPYINSAFFRHLSPKGELWDKLLPYRMLVIDTRNGNKVVGGNNPSAVSVQPRSEERRV